MFQGYNAMNARDLEERLGRRDRPRPAAGRPLQQRLREVAPLGLALPHRPLDTEPPTIERLRPLIEPYEASVWHLPQYVPEGITEGVRIVPPAIDPLSPKNMAFSPEDAAFVSEQFGIDPERPLLCQVSRFDPWKDPMGVIDA